MTRASADTVGRTLSRLSRLARRGSSSDSPTSRDEILRIVAAAGRPVSVEEVAAAADLHPNTVRTHLDVLRAAGGVQRTRERPGGRGRPRWLYEVVADDTDPQRILAGQLVEELERAESPTLADEAAARWRGDAQNGHHAATPDEAVEVAARSLEGLGFGVAVSPVGDELFLTACPYADLVADHPVICRIHAKAIEQVLSDTGQDVALGRLDVFPRPDVCVARLRRPDVDAWLSVPGDADHHPEKAQPPRRSP